MSPNEVKIWKALETDPSRWITSQEIANAAEVAARTARAYMARFDRLGYVEHVEVFPGHRFRLVSGSEGVEERRRIVNRAAKVLGLIQKGHG